jgi:hypothetical protein
MTAPSAHAIGEAMRILDQVRRLLLTDDPELAGDEALLHDLLDGGAPGTGDAMETLRRMVRASRHAQAMAAVARDQATEIGQRAARYAKRAEALRQAVAGALGALGLSRLEAPDFTATMAAGSAAVVITDPDMLPEEFVRITRAPDKAALGAALKDGRAVPGASLNNPQPSLRVLTK